MRKHRLAWAVEHILVPNKIPTTTATQRSSHEAEKQRDDSYGLVYALERPFGAQHRKE